LRCLEPGRHLGSERCEPLLPELRELLLPLCCLLFKRDTIRLGSSGRSALAALLLCPLPIELGALLGFLCLRLLFEFSKDPADESDRNKDKDAQAVVHDSISMRMLTNPRRKVWRSV
jgi:hypothetical protein